VRTFGKGLPTTKEERKPMVRKVCPKWLLVAAAMLVLLVSCGKGSTGKNDRKENEAQEAGIPAASGRHSAEVFAEKATAAFRAAKVPELRRMTCEKHNHRLDKLWDKLSPEHVQSFVLMPLEVKRAKGKPEKILAMFVKYGDHAVGGFEMREISGGYCIDDFDDKGLGMWRERYEPLPTDEEADKRARAEAKSFLEDGCTKLCPKTWDLSDGIRSADRRKWAQVVGSQAGMKVDAEGAARVTKSRFVELCLNDCSRRKPEVVRCALEADSIDEVVACEPPRTGRGAFAPREKKRESRAEKKRY